MKRFWLMFGALAALTCTAGVQAGTPFSGTVISGSSNGIGNHVSVSGTSGTTVIQGSRWGVGNSIKVENAGSSVIVNDGGVTVDGVKVSGKSTKFWSKRVWDDRCGAYLYWSAKTRGWYRFHPTDRAYYPVEVYPEE